MEVTDVEVLGTIWFSWDHFEHCYVTGYTSSETGLSRPDLKSDTSVLFRILDTRFRLFILDADVRF